jgi:hypothetical protein
MSLRSLCVCAVALLIAAGCSSDAKKPTAAATDTGGATSTTIADATAVAGDTSVPPTTAKPQLRKLRGGITAIGDSLMIDTAPALRAAIPGIDIDAAVDRSAIPGPDMLQQRLRSHRLGPDIVFDLGLNGGLTAKVLDRVIDIAGGRRVVLVTNRCGYCSWTPSQNAMLRENCTHERRCYLADWEVLANKHPEWFGSDGVHMPIGGIGAHAYAQMIRAQLTAP